MLHIIWSIIVGAIIGGIAEFFVPGTQNLGFWLCAGLGILGSVVGGLIARVFSKPPPGAPFHPAGFFLSVICSIVLLVIWGHFHHA
jgi:uncharacterized membrane protein YeaQ/YmgE (transglycosylase-associated protein family)